MVLVAVNNVSYLLPPSWLTLGELVHLRTLVVVLVAVNNSSYLLNSSYTGLQQ